MSWVAAGIGTATAVVGIVKSAKAKKEAKALDARRPKYDISPYAGQYIALAESNLSNGMSGAASQAYKEGTDKNFAASLSSILKAGGTPNTVSSVFGNEQEGLKNLSMLNESNRMAKINSFVQAHQYYNEQLDKKWAIDKNIPWHDDKLANTEERKQAAALTMSGINTAGGAMANYAGGQKTSSGYNNYLKSPSTQGNSSPSTGMGGGDVGGVAKQDSWTPQTDASYGGTSDIMGESSSFNGTFS